MAQPAETTMKAAEGQHVDSPMEERVQKLAEKVWSESNHRSAFPVNF